jgi:hypothetical protein
MRPTVSTRWNQYYADIPCVVCGDRYRSNLWNHINALAAEPDNAGYRWLGRPILLPAAPQFSDRHT